MINIGRHPCNFDRLDFSEHETGDVGQEDCDMFRGTVGLFSLNNVCSFECFLTAEIHIIHAGPSE